MAAKSDPAIVTKIQHVDQGDSLVVRSGGILNVEAGGKLEMAGVDVTAVLSPHSGTFIANGATPVTVTDTNVTANSAIVIALKTVGGTVGAIPAIKTITPTTGFTVAGTASDTSTYNYTIFG